MCVCCMKLSTITLQKSGCMGFNYCAQCGHAIQVLSLAGKKASLIFAPKPKPIESLFVFPSREMVQISSFFDAHKPSTILSPSQTQLFIAPGPVPQRSPKRSKPTSVLRLVCRRQKSMVAQSSIEGRLVLAACNPNRGIGQKGTLPWPRLSSDLKHFKNVTIGAPVLMGAVTYAGLPDSAKPLPGRLNIVLSSKTRQELGCPDSVIIVGSFDAAAQFLMQRKVRVIYVIGGESVYTQALSRPEWSQRIYYTEIVNEFPTDRVFSMDIEADDSPFDQISISADMEENGVKFRMKEYIRRSTSEAPLPEKAPAQTHEEMQYLNLVRQIIEHGVSKGDRTGVGTRSVFGRQMRFSLRHSFPLLTTKRVFWRGVCEELFWFIKGSTNANELAEKNVRIWDGNGSRSFLDSRGFTDREVGDLGPVYGFQWRHFGAEYKDMHADYTGQGKDQLQEVIDTIKRNPNDRRMLMSAWNPSATDQMALPPCHLLAQFYVANGELSCQMYQRSCDMGLGVPFNIASYSLLTCLIAKVTGLKPGEFVHVLGDAHVYNNHVDALKEQIDRTPRPFPKLSIRAREKIEDFCFEDLTLDGYSPHKAISMQMAV